MLTERIGPWNALPIDKISEDSYSNPGGSPGDGVCPTEQSLEEVSNRAYESWKISASNIADDPLCKNAFLDLMEKIPPFRLPPLRELYTDGSRPSCAEWVFRLQTSIHPDCAQREKEVTETGALAFVTWTTYTLTDKQNYKIFERDGFSLDLQHLTRLVCAWSYILSCRWVEIMRKSGGEAAILHQEGDDDFWSILHDERWRATFEASGEIYYSPFMFRSNRTSTEFESYFLFRGKREFIRTSSEHKVKVDVAKSFVSLSAFCYSNHCLDQSYLALAIVLLSRSWSIRALDLPPWSTNVNAPETEQISSKQNVRLLSAIDHFITLNYLWAGVDTLLSAVFFDPALPCNVSGAQWKGIERALNLDKGVVSPFIYALNDRCPGITLFWIGAIAIEQGRQVLHDRLGALQSINPLVSIWTSMPCSFLHVEYESAKSDRTIPRTLEFSTAFFVEPEITSPPSVSPPFGETLISNTNLTVREHLGHGHKPMHAELFWKLKKGRLAEFCPPTSYQCPLVKLWTSSAEKDNIQPRSVFSLISFWRL